MEARMEALEARLASETQLARAAESLAAARAAAESAAAEQLGGAMRAQAAEAGRAAQESAAAAVEHGVGQGLAEARTMADQARTAAAAAEAEAARVQSDALAVQRQEAEKSDAAQQRHRREVEALTARHDGIVARLEAQLEEERSARRRELESNADVYAKQVLQAEDKARAAERRAETAEDKLSQLEQAARQWTASLRK